MKKFKPYFEKLQITPNKLSLALVQEIQKKHLAIFSFNNISVLLEKEIDLCIDALIDKIVVQNLGGYCFEHNKLLYEVLKALGFDVKISIARVTNSLSEKSPRTHRITLLFFENKTYLVDAGFGAMTPTFPIEIPNQTSDDVEITEQIHKMLFINKRSEHDYDLILKKENKNLTLYTFNLADYYEADCVMGNFYSQHHPKAVFLNNFVVSKKLENVTLSFRNNIYHKNYSSNTDIIKIEDYKQLQQLLKDDFHLFPTKEESIILFEKGETFQKKNRKIIKV